MRFIPIFVCCLLLAGCTRQSPTEIVTPFEPGGWTGSFSTVIARGAPPVEGTITFIFKDASYSYTGRFATDSAPIIYPVPADFGWSGKFFVNDGTVHLEDLLDFRMVNKSPGLGLRGNYRYSLDKSTLTISNGDSDFPLTLILTKQVSQPRPA